MSAKQEVLQHIITGLTRKVQRGSVQHGEEADHIRNLTELENELYDGLFYTVNCKRVMRLALDLLYKGDVISACLLIEEQLKEVP